MRDTRPAPELERRLEQAEREARDSPGLGTRDWIFLFATGVLFPALLLIWGWT